MASNTDQYDPYIPPAGAAGSGGAAPQAGNQRTAALQAVSTYLPLDGLDGRFAAIILATWMTKSRCLTPITHLQCKENAKRSMAIARTTYRAEVKYKIVSINV
jgi:hypothetical protein